VAQAFQPVQAQAKACGYNRNNPDLFIIAKTLPDPTARYPDPALPD
jgi:hypothetical protein